METEPTVAGIDVVMHPGQVRRYIGVPAQEATLDPLLTGRPICDQVSDVEPSPIELVGGDQGQRLIGDGRTPLTRS